MKNVMVNSADIAKGIEYEKESKRINMEFLDFSYIAHYNKATKLEKILDAFFSSLNETLITRKIVKIIDSKTLIPIDESKCIKDLDFEKADHIIGFEFKVRFVDRTDVDDFEKVYPYNIQMKKVLTDVIAHFNLNLSECSLSAPIKNVPLLSNSLMVKDPENRLDHFIHSNGNYLKFILIYEIPEKIQDHIDSALYFVQEHSFEKALEQYELAYNLAKKDDYIKIIKKVSKLKNECTGLLNEFKSTPPTQLFPPGGTKSTFMELKDKMISLQENLFAKKSITKETLHPPKTLEQIKEELSKKYGEDVKVTDEMAQEYMRLRDILKGKPTEGEQPKELEQKRPLRSGIMQELGALLKSRSSEGPEKKDSQAYLIPGAPSAPSAPSSPPTSPPPAPGAGMPPEHRPIAPKAPPGGPAGAPAGPPPPGAGAPGGSVNPGLRAEMLKELDRLKRLQAGGIFTGTTTEMSPEVAKLISYDINLGMQYYSVMMAKQSYLFYLFLSHKELKIEVEEGKEIYETTFTITTTKEEPPLFKIIIKGKGFKVHPFSGKVVVDKEDEEPSMMIFSITPKKLKKKNKKEEERRNLHVYVEFEKKIVSHTVLSIIVQPKQFALDLGPVHLNLSKQSAMVISFIPVLIAVVSAVYTIMTFDFSAPTSSSSSIDFLSSFIPGIGSLIFFATFIMTILKKAVFPIKQKWTSFMNFDKSAAMMK